jgi:3-oxoacyl-[acyl-carrier protein] reductase
MTDQTHNMQNKVAVVTGASKGIGAGIAKKLASLGVRVVVNYSASKEAAERVVSEITSAGGQATAIGGSVAKPNEIEALFAATKTAHGKIDILVNNAGTYSFTPIDTLTVGDITSMFAINVTAMLLATKSALSLFPPDGGASSTSVQSSGK